MTRRITIERETRLDILARDLLGTERQGAVEALLAANPGLAWRGAYIPAGVEIAVPDIDPTALRVAASIDPWE